MSVNYLHQIKDTPVWNYESATGIFQFCYWNVIFSSYLDSFKIILSSLGDAKVRGLSRMFSGSLWFISTVTRWPCVHWFNFDLQSNDTQLLFYLSVIFLHQFSYQQSQPLCYWSSCLQLCCSNCSFWSTCWLCYFPVFVIALLGFVLRMVTSFLHQKILSRLLSHQYMLCSCPLFLLRYCNLC